MCVFALVSSVAVHDFHALAQQKHCTLWRPKFNPTLQQCIHFETNTAHHNFYAHRANCSFVIVVYFFFSCSCSCSRSHAVFLPALLSWALFCFVLFCWFSFVLVLLRHDMTFCRKCERVRARARTRVRYFWSLQYTFVCGFENLQYIIIILFNI